MSKTTTFSKSPREPECGYHEDVGCSHSPNHQSQRANRKKENIFCRKSSPMEFFLQASKGAYLGERHLCRAIQDHEFFKGSKGCCSTSFQLRRFPIWADTVRVLVQNLVVALSLHVRKLGIWSVVLKAQLCFLAYALLMKPCCTTLCQLRLNQQQKLQRLELSRDTCKKEPAFATCAICLVHF